MSERRKRLRTAGLEFSYVDSGEGLPFILLHGLGGTLEQPAGLYGEPEKGIRFLSYDLRLHGNTVVSGTHKPFSIGQLADDLASFMDALKIESAAVGGISLGAAAAMGFALKHPERAGALLVLRPAVGCEKGAANLRVYREIASFLEKEGPVRGLVDFTLTDAYRSFAGKEFANAYSCLKQFSVTDTAAAVERLSAVAYGTAFESFDQLAVLRMPVQVAATDNDSIHLISLARKIAESIPRAVFTEVVSKNISAEQHQRQMNGIIHEFLKRISERVTDTENKIMEGGNYE